MTSTVSVYGLYLGHAGGRERAWPVLLWLLECVPGWRDRFAFPLCCLHCLHCLPSPKEISGAGRKGWFLFVMVAARNIVCAKVRTAASGWFGCIAALVRLLFVALSNGACMDLGGWDERADLTAAHRRRMHSYHRGIASNCWMHARVPQSVRGSAATARPASRACLAYLGRPYFHFQRPSVLLWMLTSHSGAATVTSLAGRCF